MYFIKGFAAKQVFICDGFKIETVIEVFFINDCLIQ